MKKTKQPGDDPLYLQVAEGLEKMIGDETLKIGDKLPSVRMLSDEHGISMGTAGMSYSLQSRDLIADQVETAGGGHWLDGMVVVPGCDKNMPGVLMARE